MPCPSSKYNPLASNLDRKFARATPFRLFALTLVLLGLQLVWAVELAYGTPYLLSLGMGKSITSLVWLAGPISGLLVHPIVGAMSDKCALRMGRRRPFLILGTATSLPSMALIALSRPLGGSPDKDPAQAALGSHAGATNLTIWLAVVGFYVLDFCINAVQASSRALIVDVMAPEDQALASGIAGIMGSLGSLLGYAAGLVDWPLALGIPATPSAQLQLVCSIAGVVFVACTAFTVLLTPEVPLPPATCRSKTPPRSCRTLWNSFTQAFLNIKRVFPNIPHMAIRVYKIQLVAWLGWFPILFYSSTYVAQFTSNSHHPFEGPGAVHATQQGSLAFFAFSIVSLVISILLPWATKRWSISLPLVWVVGQCSFAAVMVVGTFMVRSGFGASALISLCGAAWAIGSWVPMSLLGQTLAEQDAGHLPKYAPLAHCGVQMESDPDLPIDFGLSSLPEENDHIYAEDYDPHVPHLKSVAIDPGSGHRKRVTSGSALFLSGNKEHLVPGHDETLLPLKLPPSSNNSLQYTSKRKHPKLHEISAHRSRASVHGSSAPAAGIVLGLHNVSVVVPQLVISIFASVIFAILPDRKDMPMVSGSADDSIGWIFRVGGISAAVSAFLIYSLLLNCNKHL